MRLAAKRVLLAAGVTLALVVGVASLASGGDPTASPAPGSQLADTTGTHDPVAQSAGDTMSAGGEAVVADEAAPALPVVVDFARTEAGARSAAVAFLELTEDAVAMTPSEAGEMQRRYATADFADEAAADTEQKMIELLEAVPAGVTVRLAPIEVRSVADGDEWVISVWFVEAISIGSDAVVDDWRTATYRLRWEGGQWRVAAFDSIRGPMPGRGNQPASATPIEFEALLAGFDDEGLG